MAEPPARFLCPGVPTTGEYHLPGAGCPLATETLRVWWPAAGGHTSLCAAPSRCGTYGQALPVVAAVVCPFCSCSGARLPSVAAVPLSLLSLPILPLRARAGILVWLDLRRAAARCARIGSNSHHEGPCPVCALRQTARVGDPSTPLAATVVASLGGWLLGSHAASNSQGWGPERPKRPAGPHLFGAPAPHVARCPCFVFGRLCHVRGPLPCWDAVVHGGTLLLAPAGECGCLACPASRIILLTELCWCVSPYHGAMPRPPFDDQAHCANRLLPAGSGLLMPGT